MGDVLGRSDPANRGLAREVLEHGLLLAVTRPIRQRLLSTRSSL